MEIFEISSWDCPVIIPLNHADERCLEEWGHLIFCGVHLSHKKSEKKKSFAIPFFLSEDLVCFQKMVGGRENTWSPWPAASTKIVMCCDILWQW